MGLNIDESPVEHGERTDRHYAAQKLATLRIEVDRLSHDVRMKTVGAGAEHRARARTLAREAKQFAARVSAGEDDRAPLMAVGEQLHARLRRLATQIAMSIH